MRALVVGAAVLAVFGATAGTGSARADEVPPGTGCCFSFDKSPIQVFFCNVQGACVIGAKP